MITSLGIERFKSVKRLRIDCRRINLFIGEPNTGKSNILEALGLLSWCATGYGRIQDFVRAPMPQNLFYDSLVDEPIRIEYAGQPSGTVTVKFEHDHFMVVSGDQEIARLHFDNSQSLINNLRSAEPIKFYRFRLLDQFNSNVAGPLAPPSGSNLFSVVFTSKALRDRMADLYRPYGLSVVMKPHEKQFEIQKQSEGIVVAYPYSMVSDTLQRALFHSVAIASNRGAIIAFEEPEAHAFPYYTKLLGEEIALDGNNQYFIATHNPYLLGAVLEKAKAQEVGVFVTYYRDFETRVRPLTGNEIGEILSGDPFFMIRRFVEEKNA